VELATLKLEHVCEAGPKAMEALQNQVDTLNNTIKEIRKASGSQKDPWAGPIMDVYTAISDADATSNRACEALARQAPLLRNRLWGWLKMLPPPGNPVPKENLPAYVVAYGDGSTSSYFHATRDEVEKRLPAALKSIKAVYDARVSIHDTYKKWHRAYLEGFRDT